MVSIVLFRGLFVILHASRCLLVSCAMHMIARRARSFLDLLLLFVDGRMGRMCLWNLNLSDVPDVSGLEDDHAEIRAQKEKKQRCLCHRGESLFFFLKYRTRKSYLDTRLASAFAHSFVCAN